MMEQHSPDNELQRELAYYKTKLAELSGESIRYDYLLSSLRSELKQRKDGLSILTQLQKEFTVATPLNEVFTETLKAINNSLGMDRSVVLLFDPNKKSFQPEYSLGYPAGATPVLTAAELLLPPGMMKEGQWLLLNRSIDPDELMLTITKVFGINYFVGVPILYEEEPVAFLLAGRLFEKLPFNPALNKADVDTLSAIASLVSGVLQNKSMEELRQEMTKQKEENVLVNRMLAELKATQQQLIHAEKMASLGELTAGIAHEIQNPLNFVNNFSELNKELLDEMTEELATGNMQQAKLIADGIKGNEEKIIHHGKRAEAIVKNMLLHSSAGAGKKESTDINQLAEEYLRLAFHGFRAKDKSFQAKIRTELEPTLKKIEIVPQEIGRVFLNLYNNALFAVDEKRKKTGGNYEPSIGVCSLLSSNRLQVIISDNGEGIPEKIIDKIFQPFFTTKDTGQGTGLGLSLSYDIIKSYGGQIKVETKHGEGTKFTIELPV